jgi:hypothetical protein
MIVVVDDVDDLEGNAECRWQRKKGELTAWKAGRKCKVASKRHNVEGRSRALAP